jgi:hypothetical protein
MQNERTLTEQAPIWSVQLCNIEAMAQIHKWKASLQLDNLIAYALATPKVSAHGITAEGEHSVRRDAGAGSISNATPRPI